MTPNFPLLPEDPQLYEFGEKLGATGQVFKVRGPPLPHNAAPPQPEGTGAHDVQLLPPLPPPFQPF